jgi:hypothetical protein
MDDLNPAAGAPPSGGSPRGRPKGTRNKTTIAIETLLEGAAEALTRKLVETALAGDGVALRFASGGCCRRGAIARSRSICRRSPAPTAWSEPRTRSLPPARAVCCRPARPWR